MIIAIIILLFCLSIFFSLSETALTSLNQVKLQTLAKSEDKKAEKLLKLIENPNEHYIVTIIGNNIVDLTIVALVVSWAMDSAFDPILAVVITISAIILFAEIIPNAIGRAIPMEIAFVVSPFIRAMIKLLKPIVWLLNKLISPL